MVKNVFAFIGILAVLLLGVSVVSAGVLTIENTSAIQASATQGDVITINFNVTHDGSTSGNYSLSWADSSSEFTTLPTLDLINISEEKSDFAILTIPSSVTGDIEFSLNVTGTDTGTAKAGYSFIIDVQAATSSSADTLCEIEGYADQGDLEISDFDINNNGEGDDEEWQFLDELEITVEVENTHNDENVDDVEVKIVVYDTKITSSMTSEEIEDADVTNNFDFDDETLTDIGKLKDGDEESVTFFIEELPADLDDGTYYLYVMAYEDGNESSQCMSKSNKIDDDDKYFKFSVESVDSDESVVARGAELLSVINTYCGQKGLEISVPIYNLGSDEEEKVLVSLYNSEMGINEYAVIDDLDNGDKEVATFFIDIPENLAKERYDLDITAYFDWDDDEDDEDTLAYDEETSDESIRLNILACTGAEPSINARLDSEAKLGEELIVKAIITNNGNDNDFVVSVSDFESWASLISVSPQTESVNTGEFMEVTIKLTPTSAGTQSFKINTIVDGESHDQTVSVNIEEDPGLFGGLSDIMVYTIIGIIAILILIFLVLIAKMSRRPVKPQF